MADEELSTAGFKVWIVRQHTGTLDKTIISSRGVCVCSGTSIIQSGKDPGWTAFFNKLAYNLIVEKFDWRPFDLLANIFLLFCLQSQLDEYLLEFLVDVVNAQLFKRIVLKADDQSRRTANRDLTSKISKPKISRIPIT